MEPYEVAKTLNEEVLLEQFKIPYAEFLSGDFYGPEIETEPKSITLAPENILLKYPQIGRRPDVFLPTFSTDFDKPDWRKIIAYMRFLKEEGNPVEIEGYGGFTHEGGLFPGTDERIASGNAQMLRDIQYHDQANTIIAAKINGKDLNEIKVMPIRVRFHDVPKDETDWQREVREKIQELQADGVIGEVVSQLPGTWFEYNAIEAELRPNKIILYSPKNAQGFYVINDTITLYEPGPDGPQPSGVTKTWYEFLNMFATARDKAGKPDPTKPLEEAGFDVDEMRISSSGAVRQRLMARKYLEMTGQGIYAARHMAAFANMLEKYAYGEETTVFGEEVEEFLNTICEARLKIKETGMTPGLLAGFITEDPDISLNT